MNPLSPLPFALIVALAASTAVAQNPTLMNPNRSAWHTDPRQAEITSRMGGGQHFHAQPGPRISGSTGTLFDGRPGRFGQHLPHDPMAAPQIGSGPGRLYAPPRFGQRWWPRGTDRAWPVYDQRTGQWR